MRTLALYDKNPYSKEFRAHVISCDYVEDHYETVLGQTLFFPEQGGQTSDRGRINDVEIYDVQIRDDIIYHYSHEPLMEGMEIHGVIDWRHRFNNMQQHTGEHIFTGLAHNRYGAENVGFHLSDNTVTLDLNIELSGDQLLGLEKEANNVIAENRQVKCYYPDPDILSAVEYRSKKVIEGSVRLVEIVGIDLCACCAPHVSTSSQVGIFKILSAVKYKGGVRVTFLCGLRAQEDYCRRMKILRDSYQLMNCNEEALPGKITSLLEENKNIKYKLSLLQREVLKRKLEAYPKEVPDVIAFTEEADIKNMRECVNALIEEHTGLCGIFSGNDMEGYTFVIGSKTVDCSAIATALRQQLSAKGGGSKLMVQGSVMATKSQIEETQLWHN